MYLETGGFAVCVIMHFGEEGGSESGFMEFVELVVYESEEKTALSDSAVSYDNDLNVPLVLVHRYSD